MTTPVAVPPGPPAEPEAASRADRLAPTGTVAAPLYTRRFLAICTITLLGFAQNFLLQPILPLLVLHLGGDATVVGIVFAVFSIPSIVLRPRIGHFADRWGLGRVLLAGTAGMGVLAPLYLLPSILVLLLIRVVHGVVWGAFSLGATAVMARTAPAARRVEASSVFDLMPGIASLIMPAVGLLLLDATGFVGPFTLATVLGASATLVAFGAFGRRDARPRPASPTGERRGLLERSAVFQMTVMLLFTTAASLFLVYPPLLAQDRGIPVSDLALFYPAFGIALVVSRALAGRYLERVPRSTALAGAAVIAAVGLLIAATAGSLALLTAGGMVFAVAYGFAPPTAMASVIERAHPDRLGGAMATYTIGFQIGSGLGAALWGVLIGPLGFTIVFVLAAAIQAALFVATLACRASLDAGGAEAA